jgi:hypothetical protein
LEKQFQKSGKSLVLNTIAVNDKWESADLIRRLCHALDYAKQTIEYLALEGFTNPDDSNNNIRPEKIIGETAFLMLAASTAGAYIEVSSRIKELACILIPYARNKKTLLNICLQPALVMDFAQAHICLSKIGYPDTEFDLLISKSVGSHAHYGHERIPHRMLEQEWIKKIGNFHSKYSNSVTKTISFTALANPIDLLNGTRDDIYAFTHALMYVSNFNISPWKLPRTRKELTGEAEAMLAKCLDEQDYDLCGEVLLSWPLTGKSWSATSNFAFHVLAHVEDKVGFLPSPSTRIETLQKLEDDNRKKYLYGTSYHTVYVMGLLSSVTLHQGKNPSKRILRNNPVSGSANKIMSYLNQGDYSPHWMELYNQLNESEKDSVAGFLLNVALIRDVRKKAFGRVYELLKIGYEFGLTDTAIARQTAELLERLEVFPLSEGTR